MQYAHGNAKSQSLLKSTTIVSLMTLISRLFGFVRDMILAQLFGADAGMDAFIIAFRIPNFMRRLFAEGAFSQAFVPVLSEYQKTKDPIEVQQFLSRVSGSLMLVLAVVTLIGILITPGIVDVFAPGFRADPARHDLAILMLRWTFPYLMFISLTAMAGAVFNTYGYFAVPAITPVILNLCMITAAMYVSPWLSTPVFALAVAVFLAGLFQFLFQLPFLYHRKLWVKPTVCFQDAGVVRVLKLMVPALFGVSIAQLNLMVDTIFASFLKIGSVTWLFYTDRLTDFPLGVFGVAIATVILPHLSKRHAVQDHLHFSQSLDWGIRLLLLIGVPAAVGLVVFSMPLIATCFAYGHFTATDVIQTQKSLVTLGLGVPAFMMVKVLASGFYAQQDIKTPVKIGAWMMILNSILCALFIVPFAHAGLTLASTLASILNCLILLVLLYRRGYYHPTQGWLLFLVRLGLSNVFLAVGLYAMQHDLMYWLARPMSYRLFTLLGHVTLAWLAYLGMLWILGMRIDQFRGKTT